MSSHDYSAYTEHLLLDMRQQWLDEMTRINRFVQEVEAELRRRMEARGAEVAEFGSYAVELKRPAVWYRDRLLPLLECEEIPEAALREAYTPAHEETVQVEAKWNMTKAKTLTKYGARAREIIEAAQGQGDPVLTVKPKQAVQAVQA